jgi:hypothetical protein
MQSLEVIVSRERSQLRSIATVDDIFVIVGSEALQEERVA